MPINESHLRSALEAAIASARRFVGATAPNPPVGAAALDPHGEILSVQAHERAGTAHAEAKVLADLRERGLLDRLDTLVVTLEPCNHQGRVGPCTEAILKARSLAHQAGGAGLRSVVFGTIDPNPRVAGQGAERLRQAGIQVREWDPAGECRELIRSFEHWITTGLPWVVVKTARTREGSMIPPAGQKTFTSPQSLRLAHELRRRADAIVTGSGTILADRPEFTVRHVPDHDFIVKGLKKRKLVVLDRRGRTPPDWIRAAEARGFEVLIRTNYEEALIELGKLGVLEALIEAGPELSAFVLQSPLWPGQSPLWNEHVLITQGNPDQVAIERRISRPSCSPASSKP